MTAFLVQYRRAAIEDITQIHEYLNSEASLELADRFVMAVEHTVQQVSDFPYAGALVPGRSIRILSMRRWPVKAFPRYYIYYTADDQRVIIVRIIHSARDTSRQTGL